MPTIANSAEQDQRRAWADYADRLRGLEGAEYERVEQEAWEELQVALREVPGAPTPPNDPVG
jgi:hypothetical protein